MTWAPVGGRPDLTEALVSAFQARGLGLAVAPAVEAEVLVIAHALEAGDAVETTFGALTELAARTAPPALLVHVGDTSMRAAGAAAVVKTAGREWAAETVCVIVEEATAAAEAVADELASGGGEREVRRGAVRKVRTRVDEAPAGPARALPSGPWIVSGGARGVTAACCVALAEEGMRQVVLLGRSPLADEPVECKDALDEAGLKRALLALAPGKPDLPAVARQAREILAQREVRGTLQALEAAGCHARYASVDVTDAEAVRVLVDETRASWGPIRGVVHAAGVLADKRLGEKTPAQFQSVLRTKMDGAEALMAACSEDPLEVLCFFSSVAAHSGNPGQSDYAAANAMLDHWATTEAAVRGATCRVVSVAWGPWDGGMVNAALAKHFTARGVGLIPLADGAQALVRELELGCDPQVIVGCGLDDGDAPRPATMSWQVDRIPQLADHRIQDAVVLPMTVALDALLGVGRRTLGPRVRLRDLQLFQGALLAGGKVETQVGVEPQGEDAVRVTLTHPDGRPAYRAVVERSESSLTVPGAIGREGNHPDVCSEPYAEALFHGPAFQVIREVTAFGDDGLVARLATAGAMGWPAEWQLDPVALDGALQLLRVWGWAADGRPSLPTAIAACDVGAPWPSGGEILCHLGATREQGTRLRGDAVFTDLDGTVVYARLSGIQMHVQGS
jgi:NAD(P)-dependent dehydrogenase (short-subunit alcohol dehydrogenase family)